MNDKIKQLAEQAGFMLWQDEAHNPGDVIDWAARYDDELIKYTELVVQECLECSEDLSRHYIQNFSEQEQALLLASIADYSSAIKRKFTEFTFRYDETTPVATQNVENGLKETDLYDFAGWLTTREGLLQVGSSYEAGSMADAVGEYINKFPERFAKKQNETPVKYETIDLEFSDEELLKYMKMAHELDITFNQLVERALKEVILNAPIDLDKERT